MNTVNTVVTGDPEIFRELDLRLARTCTHEVVESAEHEWAAALWTSLADDGFHAVGLPDELGGSGGGVADACLVLRAAGHHAAPLPLAESGLLAGWIASATGRSLPEGVFTVAPMGGLSWSAGDGAGTLSGSVHRVPWGRTADHVGVLVAGDTPAVAVLARSEASVGESVNLAGEPRDSLTFDRATPVAYTALPGGSSAAQLQLLGALSRAALAAGAVERLTDLTVRYTSERRQFGRAIGSFQAVQQHIVAAAEATALLKTAVEVAAAEVAAGAGECEVAAAKVLSCRAATLATRAAHQAHGAMGMTREYPLHQFSRRLWSWSTEYGDERYWTRWLGRNVTAGGADGLYPFITRPRQLVGLP